MARNQTAWSSSTKNTDVWAATTKNSTAWNNESNFPASYAYSDASLTYNSPTRPYNYITAVPADQSNNRNPTAWTGATRSSINWSNESTGQIGYLFDSIQTYDSTYTFDFTTFVANQSNNKSADTWMVVV